MLSRFSRQHHCLLRSQCNKPRGLKPLYTRVSPQMFQSKGHQPFGSEMYFMGSESFKQFDITYFLKVYLDPIIVYYNCGYDAHYICVCESTAQWQL